MVAELSKLQENTFNKLIKRLINDFNILTAQYLELIKIELKEEIALVGKYAILVVTASLLAYTSLIFLGLFATLLMSQFIPMWSSALIVTFIYFIISGIMLLYIKNKIKEIKKPARELGKEVKETVEDANKWLQNMK